MIRFFIKSGTLRLQGTIYDVEESPQFPGDINRLIEVLRQCSSYQIDRNHAHCGLRVRLIPLLDLIQIHLNAEAGMCLECWKNHRASYGWSVAKRPVLWIRSRASNSGRGLVSSLTQSPSEGKLNHCLDRHTRAREMFTAADRDWADSTS